MARLTNAVLLKYWKDANRTIATLEKVMKKDAVRETRLWDDLSNAKNLASDRENEIEVCKDSLEMEARTNHKLRKDVRELKRERSYLKSSIRTSDRMSQLLLGARRDLQRAKGGRDNDFSGFTKMFLDDD